MLKRIFLYSSTFVLAMCSILYELTLAQTLAAIRGDTILRYNITIGLYCAALGTGALSYGYWRKKKNIHSLFINTELLLSVVGASSTVLLMLFDLFMYRLAMHYQLVLASSLIQLPITVFCRGMILVIGFLSGIELPLLMEMGNRIRASSGNRILVTDYVGTFAGTALFPLFLLPRFGIFFVAFFTGLLNVLVALVYILREPQQQKKYSCAALCIATALLIALSFNAEIQRSLMNIYCY